MYRTTILGALTSLFLAYAPLAAQTGAESVSRLVASSQTVTVAAGDAVPFTVDAFDSSGALLHVPLRITGPREAAEIVDGMVHGMEPGEYEIVVTVVIAAGSSATPPTLRVPLVVTWPRPREVELMASATLFAGTTVAYTSRVLHADGSHRPDPNISWRSSAPAVATVDAFGNVTAHTTGSGTITAAFEGVEQSLSHSVSAFPGVALELRGAPTGRVRTGDVVRFEAVVRNAAGQVVADAPIGWSHAYTATDGMMGVPATGQMHGGAFVADVPGIHTVTASVGPLSARASFEADPRDVVQELEVVGHTTEDWYRTTDIWVFEGVDGRDYAITGSKVSGGFAFFYDVTDPATITKIDSIQVDARTVNDVKASPDGRYAVISREGATNRRDGLVILDMADPRHPKVASIYDDQITGGVHNMFAENDLLYALANGQVRHHRCERHLRTQVRLGVQPSRQPAARCVGQQRARVFVRVGHRRGSRGCRRRALGRIAAKPCLRHLLCDADRQDTRGVPLLSRIERQDLPVSR